MELTNFFRSVKFTIGREGREFVFHPLDHGGPTKFGITQRTLGMFRNAIVSDEDVKQLTEDEAIKIYAAVFWNAPKLERVKDPNTALILFDFGVNAGPFTSIRLLQNVLNDKFAENLVADGIFGNSTHAALCTAREDRLNRYLLQAIQLHYIRICKLNITQIVFLEGWINRTHALWSETF